MYQPVNNWSKIALQSTTQWFVSIPLKLYHLSKAFYRKWLILYISLPGAGYSTLVMDRITATATAVFFQQPRIFQEIFIQERVLFYLFWSSKCNYVIATYYFFFVIVQKRIYGSIYFPSLLYLNFFNTYY